MSAKSPFRNIKIVPTQVLQRNLQEYEFINQRTPNEAFTDAISIITAELERRALESASKVKKNA